MKILFVSNLYPPSDMGGFEQWCQEVALGLRHRGHTVYVLTSQHGLNHTQLHRQDVIPTLHLQANIRRYRPLDFFLKRGHQERSNERELKRAIDQLDPDLVLVWGMWNLSRNLPFLAEQRMLGRVAYYIASYWPIDPDIHEEYWLKPAKRSMTGLIMRPLRAMALSQLRREGYPPSLRFEHVKCCSQYVRDKLVQSGKVPGSAGVLFGGVDPEPFLINSPTAKQTGEGPLRLLYFGSLLPHKGVHTALEALAILRQRGLADCVDLTILGGGHPDYETRLRTIVAQFDLGSQVHFAGWVPRDEVPSWLKRFDVYLFTSIWAEPMARAVMEAMTASLLVIGTEVGGQVEMLLDGKNGLTFQAEDPAGLADCIVRAIEDPALRQCLAQAGQQSALERFTLDRMVDDIETWLKEIVT